MVSSLTKVIVKVGNTSKLIFRNTKAYRAITIKELNRLVELYPDSNIVIIENIKENEYDGLKSFIQSKKDNFNVYFYVPDNNDVTCGLADELIYPIFLNTESLFKAIQNDTGLNLSNDVTKNIISDTQNLDINDFENAFDPSFNTTIESIDEYRSKIQTEEIELPTISNKDDIESFNILDEEVKDTTEEKEEEQISNVTIKSDDILLVKYHDMETERDSLKNQLKSAMDRIQHLTELNEAISDERDTVKSMIESFGNIDEIIEEPISLSEYSELKDKLDKLTEENKKLQERLNDINQQSIRLKQDSDEKDILKGKLKEIEDECEKHKKTIADLEETVSLRDKTIDDISNDCRNLRLEIETIRSTIDEDKLASAQNEITELNSRITELEDRLTTSSESLQLANSELAQAREDLDNAINNLTTANNELSNKIEEITSLQNEITILNEEKQANETKIQELNAEVESLQEKINNYDTLARQVDELTKLKASNEQQIEQDKAEIERLTILTGDVEKRIELARGFVQDELNAKVRENLELQGKLDIVTAQLAAKEIQYNDLVKISGIDSSGASTVLENSKMLEEINKTLRNQIVTLKREVERSEKEREFAHQNARALDEQNKQLRMSIKAMSAGLTGSGSVSSLPPCNYTGKGMIIPVFGCGSFGITTTAMSIATKLAAQSRVLYIDFDMVNPKADAWFKINPIVKNIPDYDKNNTRATGLGLFVDKQMPYFMQYASSIINRAISTKGGSIDYLSGFYAKPDTIKLISADFTSLLNYCGNNYTYTIIDFGKLGCSDINDQIIKMVSDIAYRSVVVTTSEKLEIRTFRIKINDTGIDINNIAWLINMCTTTGLETTAKMAISPAKYSMMPLNMDMYGNKVDFTREKLTRDKLQLFMDEVLFNK